MASMGLCERLKFLSVANITAGEIRETGMALKELWWSLRSNARPSNLSAGNIELNKDCEEKSMTPPLLEWKVGQINFSS
jgi:hypothetical protein